MAIETYHPNDQQDLIELWQQLFPNNGAHNEPALMLAAKREVDDLIFVAKEGGELVGACMAGYDGHRGWLYAVSVRPDHQGEGIGRALVTHALDALREIGCIKVNLQVREDNKQVVQFYEALGFSVEPRVSMGLLLY